MAEFDYQDQNGGTSVRDKVRPGVSPGCSQNRRGTSHSGAIWYRGGRVGSDDSATTADPLERCGGHPGSDPSNSSLILIIITYYYWLPPQRRISWWPILCRTVARTTKAYDTSRIASS